MKNSSQIANEQVAHKRTHLLHVGVFCCDGEPHDELLLLYMPHLIS